MTLEQKMRFFVAGTIYAAKLHEGGMTPRLIREAVEETDLLLAALNPPEPELGPDGEPPLF